MHFARFFKLAWAVQLLVGVALFGVSFYIENEILQAFFAAPVVALVLALSLETGKAASIVWHRYLAQGASEDYPPVTRLVSATFRGGLVLLSLLCSLLYLGVQLDRPNLNAVRDAELAAIDSELAQALARLDAERETRLERDQRLRDREYADARRDHQGQVDELEALLRAEMDNTVNGVFRGPRYQELETRLATARRERDAALAALSTRHREQADRLAAEFTQRQAEARAGLRKTAEQQRAALYQGRLDLDERTQDPRVVSLTHMIRAVTDWQLSPPLFTLLFAVFISLVVELGIVLAFDTVTLSMRPALAVQHREEVMTEAMMAEMNGTAEREGLRHRDAMDRVRKGGERIGERARAAATNQRDDQREAA